MGFYIDRTGLTTDGQVMRNLKKASTASSLLRAAGIFKNKLNTNIVLRVWASKVIPILEYGLNWHQPNKIESRKIDKFIRKEIRRLTGTPKYTPNEDLQSLFQFSTFFCRWKDLNSRFLNHRAYKCNDKSAVVIQEKVQWNFKLHNQINKLIKTEPIVGKIVMRKFIDPLPALAICTKCDDYHEHVNEHIQCRFKQFDAFLSTNPVKNTTPNITVPKTILNTSIAKLLIDNDSRIHIYTDASYCPSSHRSNGGIVLFNKSGTFKYYGINNYHLNIRSSTRGEIATIVEAINRTAKQKKVKIYTDSKNAIESFKMWCAGNTCYSKIESADLWSQLKKNVDWIEIEKVDGHKNDKLNNFVDGVAHLGHKYSNSKLKIIGNAVKVTRLENDKNHFRIYDLLMAIRKRTLKRQEYLDECVDLGQWFKIATTLANT